MCIRDRADSSMFIAGAAMWITGRKMKNHVEKSGQDEEKRREKAKKNTAKKTQIPESWKIMFDEEERDPKEYATEREKAAAEGPEAVRLQPAAVAAPPPVSYTHLDVYKRQILHLEMYYYCKMRILLHPLQK